LRERIRSLEEDLHRIEEEIEVEANKIIPPLKIEAKEESESE